MEKVSPSSKSVGLQIVHPENGAEDLLHIPDPRADADRCAGFCLDERRGAQMVCMGVGFEHALDRHAFLFGGGEDCLGRAHVSLARSDIEVEHGVDHRALGRVRVPDKVADRVSRFVEESSNVGVRHDASPSDVRCRLTYISGHLISKY